MSSDPYFKVTTFLKLNIGRTARLKYNCTRGKIPNIWNGTMFGEHDWPLSASRGFVSISGTSCYHWSTCHIILQTYYEQFYYYPACSTPYQTMPCVVFTCKIQYFVPLVITAADTRSSADADNGLDAFSGQSRSTNTVPFWVHCDFSLSMWSAPRATDSLRQFHSSSVL